MRCCVGRLTGAVVIAAGAWVGAGWAAPAETGGWELVWADEFDGEGLDPAKWNVVVGGGGFGNNERQFYTGEAENLSVGDGVLRIRARAQEREGHPYTSAKITTRGKGEWTYGRVEVRARLPAGRGIWPAIWMMPPDMRRYGGWPSCGEIDLMELVGHTPATVYGTLHYGNPHTHHGGSFSLPDGATFADAYHDFRLDWAPGRIDWYVDGVRYHTETNWFTSSAGARWPAPFDRAFYLQLNLAVGGNWPGYPDPTTRFPQEMAVDHVRVYRYLGEYPPVEDRPSRPAFLDPREPMPDGNLVYNGDFSEGQKHWEFGRYEGGGGEAAAVDGGVRIEVTQPGSQPWSLQLIQRPVSIMRERSYRLSFRARSDRARPLEVNVGKASQPWDSYSRKRTVDLGPEGGAYEILFTMGHASDPIARVEFNAGGQAGPVWLDDVSLRETGGEAAGPATTPPGPD